MLAYGQANRVADGALGDAQDGVELGVVDEAVAGGDAGLVEAPHRRAIGVEVGVEVVGERDRPERLGADIEVGAIRTRRDRAVGHLPKELADAPGLGADRDAVDDLVHPAITDALHRRGVGRVPLRRRVDEQDGDAPRAGRRDGGDVLRAAWAAAPGGSSELRSRSTAEPESRPTRLAPPRAQHAELQLREDRVRRTFDRLDDVCSWLEARQQQMGRTLRVEGRSAGRRNQPSCEAAGDLEAEVVDRQPRVGVDLDLQVGERTDEQGSRPEPQDDGVHGVPLLTMHARPINVHDTTGVVANRGQLRRSARSPPAA